MNTSLPKKQLRNYYLTYSLFFALTCFLVYLYFLVSGKTLIWSKDGYQQHYTAFIYYGRYLRQLIRGLLSDHRLVIRSFDFTLGEGSDVIQALNYYVIGDPFALLSVAFPAKYAYIGFDLSVILRLYFAGAAFSFFCFEKKQSSVPSILAGALCYCFCQWCLINSLRHPFFINPMIWLPLIAAGTDRILSGRRPYLYIAAVFLAAVSNFYYFYMIVLLTILYVFTRLFVLYRRDLRQGFRLLLQIGVFSVMAVALAGVLFLPVLRFFLIDNRNALETDFLFLYPVSYYSRMPALFLVPKYPYWLCLGFSAPALLSLFLLMRRRDCSELRFYLLLSLIFILFPVFGQIFNGLSYPANRWCFAVALPVSYSLVLMFEDLTALTTRQFRFLLLCLSVYLIICFLFSSSRQEGASIFFLISFLLVLLFFLHPGLDENGQPFLTVDCRKKILLLAVILGVAFNSFWFNFLTENNYASAILTPREIEESRTAESDTVREITGSSFRDDSFSRICGPNSTWNQGTLTGLPYTNYFWSISSPYQFELWNELQMSEYLSHSYADYNRRSPLLSLAGVEYLTSKGEPDFVPYGFADIPGQEHHDPEQFLSLADSTYWLVYKNENTLPLGYCYDSAVSAERWRALNPLERQELMLQDVVLDSPPEAYTGNGVLSSRKIPYEIEYQDDSITLSDGAFTVTKKNAVLWLEFDELEEGELYLHMTGSHFDDITAYDLYLGDERFDPLDHYDEEDWNTLSPSEKEEILRGRFFYALPSYASLTFTQKGKAQQSFSIYTPAYNQYNGLEDFLYNLGTTEGVKYVGIKFSAPGIYSFDSLDLYVQPMTAFSGQIAELKKDVLQNIRMGTDDVSGTISLEKPRILCLSIPYSEGWSATVDGEEAELLQANIRHMALALDAGDHEIRLHYRTPLQREGAVLSLMGLAALAAYALWDHRRRRFAATEKE